MIFKIDCFDFKSSNWRGVEFRLFNYYCELTIYPFLGIEVFTYHYSNGSPVFQYAPNLKEKVFRLFDRLKFWRRKEYYWIDPEIDF